MKPIRITRQEADDQQHLNAAYRRVRRAVNELRRVKDPDNDLYRVMRALYEIEDTLHQYVADLDGCEVVE